MVFAEVLDAFHAGSSPFYRAVGDGMKRSSEPRMYTPPDDAGSRQIRNLCRENRTEMASRQAMAGRQ